MNRLYREITMKIMQSTAMLTGCILSVLALPAVTLSSKAGAQSVSQNRPQQCTNKTLQGYYAAQSSGLRNNDSTPTNELYLDEFDGNGNIRPIKSAVSFGGTIRQNIGHLGTYQVESDCTVTFKFPNPTADGPEISSFGVIIGNGDKILEIATTPGLNVSGTRERVRY